MTEKFCILIKRSYREEFRLYAFYTDRLPKKQRERNRNATQRNRNATQRNRNATQRNRSATQRNRNATQRNRSVTAAQKAQLSIDF